MLLELFQLPEKAVIRSYLQTLVLHILERRIQAQPILANQVRDQDRAGPGNAQIAVDKEDRRRGHHNHRKVATVLHQRLAVLLERLLHELQRSLERLVYLLIVAVLHLHMQILQLLLEHTLVLDTRVYHVRDVQLPDDLPVLGLDGAAYVDLLVDDTVRVDGQVLAPVDR